jgi:hypothetical protein
MSPFLIELVLLGGKDVTLEENIPLEPEVLSVEVRRIVCGVSFEWLV